jgi:hypothetical protein
MKLAIIQDRRVLMDMEREEIIRYLSLFLADEAKMPKRKRAKLEKQMEAAFSRVEDILKQKTIYVT